MAGEEIRNSARIGEKEAENTAAFKRRSREGRGRFVEWNKGKECLLLLRLNWVTGGLEKAALREERREVTGESGRGG